MPVVDGQLGGDDGGAGAGAGAIVDDLQQVGAHRGLERGECPVVQDQHFGAGEPGQPSGEAALAVQDA